MQQHNVQNSALPAIVLAYLADSELDFIDLSGLEEVMIKEEQAQAKGIIRMSVETKDRQPTVVDYGQGTLSGRLRQIAYDCCVDDKLQDEFRREAMEHPAYAKVREEIVAAVRAGREKEDQMFDYLESLGIEVALDRSVSEDRQKIVLGLNLSALCKGFSEHSPITDLRNADAINLVNGINRYFNEKEPRQESVQVNHKTFYLPLALL